jgi:hypothetical protein
VEEVYKTLRLTHPDQARELMLVHPNSIQLLTEDVNEKVHAAATQPSAQGTADRLKEITYQLEQLRVAVDALRADLEAQQKAHPVEAK